MFLVLFHRALHWCLQPLNPQLDPLWKCWYPCSHECLVISSSSTTLQHIHAYTPSCTCTEPSFLFCSQRVLKQLDSACHSSFFSWNSSAGTLCPKTTWKSSQFFWLCTSCAKSKEHPLTIRATHLLPHFRQSWLCHINSYIYKCDLFLNDILTFSLPL